mmetsp:Transcript_1519/g.3035  ORF Transcript_1519/g.3035 Transcript_1519/m.3035 type:complete len:229 (-) Transcript_1519:135-821(-)
MLPATIDPTRFFTLFTSTRLADVVFNTLLTMSSWIIVSQTTLFPRPSIQFTADGFLSVQKFPEILTTSILGKVSCRKSRALVTPLEIMFMPMASPVAPSNRRNTLRPATFTLIPFSLANRLVLSKSEASFLSPDMSASTQSFKAAAPITSGILTTGARVIPSLRTALCAPPLRAIALQPRLVEATKQPSVVAMGTMYCLPSRTRGPATPTGMGMYPITFSQLTPITCS